MDDLAAFGRPHAHAVRYEPPERLHITLRYFGDLDEPEIDALCVVTAEVAALAQPTPMVLGPATERLGGDGTLVIPAAGAEHLATLVDQVIATMGLDERLPEREEHFFGHLTVARLRRGAELDAALVGVTFSSSFTATMIQLIHSVADQEGRRYHRVANELLVG